MMNNNLRICPACRIREGIHVSGDLDNGVPYIIFCCPNPRCLEVWRIRLEDSENAEL